MAKKKKGQNDKQRSTKHTHKTKDRVTRTPLKIGCEIRCSGRVCSSCSSGNFVSCLSLMFMISNRGYVVLRYYYYYMHHVIIYICNYYFSGIHRRVIISFNKLVSCIPVSIQWCHHRFSRLIQSSSSRRF
jgi:hypothetical protein